jgi:hypothetical protein
MKLNYKKPTAASHCSCFFLLYSRNTVKETVFSVICCKVNLWKWRPCTHHKSMWGIGGTAPLPHIEVSCQLTSLTTLSPAQHPLNRRLGAPQSQSGHFREDESLLPPWFLGCPGNSLVVMLHMLSWLQREAKSLDIYFFTRIFNCYVVHSVHW